MELAAIFLVGRSSPTADSIEPEAAGCAGLSSGDALALWPLLGAPVVHHMAGLLQAQGFSKIVVLSEAQPVPLSAEALAERKALDWQQVAEGQMWRCAESAFLELAAAADEVLVARTGEFFHLDVQDLLTHHYEKHCRVTAVVTPQGQPLHAYLISANRRNDAAYLLRSGLKEMRTSCTPYVFRGYRSSLRTAGDFRKLTIDALLRRAPIQPRGTEARPGVWLAAGARVEPGARLVPPVYVGERARVMAGALVTRCAVLEHGVVVGRGGVVENATLLPYTRLGPNLELRHSIASGSWVVHLRRRVVMQIGDTRLLGPVPAASPWNPAALFASVIDFCFLRSLRGLLASLPGASRAREPNQERAPALVASDHRPPKQESQGFVADVAVARRYGDQ